MQCKAAQYREWNALIDAQVPSSFEVPTAAKYKAGTWTPCAEADGIIQVIIGHQDSLYLRHRLHFFRWAVWDMLEKARACNEYISKLQSSKNGTKKQMSIVTKAASEVQLRLCLDVGNPALKEKEERWKELCSRLNDTNKRLKVVMDKQKGYYDRSIVYEEVWHMLQKYRTKEDEERRSDGRRAIWDLAFGDMPEADEASADGNTPPPSPPHPDSPPSVHPPTEVWVDGSLPNSDEIDVALQVLDQFNAA